MRPTSPNSPYRAHNINQKFQDHMMGGHKFSPPTQDILIHENRDKSRLGWVSVGGKFSFERAYSMESLVSEYLKVSR